MSDPRQDTAEVGAAGDPQPRLGQRLRGPRRSRRRVIGYTASLTAVLLVVAVVIVFLVRDDDVHLGERLATLGWDQIPGAVVVPFRPIAFSSTADLLVTGRLYDPFDPDEEVILDEFMIWDISDPTEPAGVAVLGEHSHWVTAAEFHPGGRLLATGDSTGRVVVWDMSDPVRAATVATLDHPYGRLEALAYSPDGQVLATVGELDTSGTAATVLWDVRDTAAPVPLTNAMGTPDVEESAQGVAFSPDGGVLLTAHAATGINLVFWDITTASDPEATSTLDSRIGGERLLARDVHLGDGDLAAVGGRGRHEEDGRVVGPVGVLALLRQARVLSTIRMGGEVHDVELHPDGGFLAAAATGLAPGQDPGEQDGALLWTLRDPARPALVSKLYSPGDNDVAEVERGAVAVEFSPDGEIIATAGRDGGVVLWRVP